MNKINIIKKASIYKSIFIGALFLNEIKTIYHCCNCNEKIIFEIIPFKTGRYSGN